MRRKLLSFGVALLVGVGVTVGVGALLGLAPLVALGGGIIAGGGLAAFAASAIGAAAAGVATSLLDSWFRGEKPRPASLAVAAVVSVVAGAATLGITRGLGALLAPLATKVTSSRVAGSLAAKFGDIGLARGQKLRVFPDEEKMMAAVMDRQRLGSIYQNTGDYVMNSRITAPGEVTFQVRPSFPLLLAGYDDLFHEVLRTQARQDGLIGAAVEAEVTETVRAASRTSGIMGALGAATVNARD